MKKKVHIDHQLDAYTIEDLEEVDCEDCGGVWFRHALTGDPEHGTGWATCRCDPHM